MEDYVTFAPVDMGQIHDFVKGGLSGVGASP